MSSGPSRELPTGTLTFVFADIEGSTDLLERLGAQYGEVLHRYHQLVRGAVAEHGGAVVDSEGDGMFGVFTEAPPVCSGAVQRDRHRHVLAARSAEHARGGDTQLRRWRRGDEAMTRDRVIHSIDDSCAGWYIPRLVVADGTGGDCYGCVPGPRRDEPVAEVEFESKIRISREQAGERLITLGKSLIGGARSKLEHEGDSIHFTVANELDWEFELNIDGDEVELEIELKWQNRNPVARAAPAARAARSTRAAGVVSPTPTTPRAASKRAKSSRRASS